MGGKTLATTGPISRGQVNGADVAKANLEPEDLVALTAEAAAMARAPLAGTDWIPGLARG